MASGWWWCGGEVNASKMGESERGASEKGDGMECDEVVGGKVSEGGVTRGGGRPVSGLAHSQWGGVLRRGAV
jgi:hypothetical protein